MKFIKEIVSTYLRIFVPKEYPTLGRWNVRHDPKTIYWNMDQANMDHSCAVHEFQKEKEDKLLVYYL